MMTIFELGVHSDQVDFLADNSLRAYHVLQTSFVNTRTAFA